MAFWRDKICGRTLTVGERSMVQSVFRDAVATERIRVFGRTYLPLMGHTAMSPNGNLYFPSEHYCLDFSLADVSSRVWFMHEMTHVWQYQMRYPLRWEAFKLLLSGHYHNGKAYEYDQKQALAFSAYNLEQQAQIIGHYYHSTLSETQMPFLNEAVAVFLQNPKNQDLLPKYDAKSVA